MGLISQSVKNLKGGISQQPDILRFANQGAQQINGWSSETQGLQKRPPSTFVKRLGNRGALGAQPLVHLINRDAQEQYYTVFTGNGIRVFHLDGTEREVRGYNGYANSNDPRNDIRLVTIADYTFVVNRKRVVNKGVNTTHAGYPNLQSRALIVVRGGQYGRVLECGVNGVPMARVPMPPGDEATLKDPWKNANKGANGQNIVWPISDEGKTYQVDCTDATWIANEMARQINTFDPANWGATAGEGWVMIYFKNGGPAIGSVYTKDGYADQLLSGFIHQLQSFNKLPAKAPDGYLVEITGEAGKTGDNYWLRYDGVGKVWKETVRPGIIDGLAWDTMPHALINHGGYFEWKMLSWDQRKSGDDETNPMPSFVGNTINDVFFFRNRLGFLSGENVIMSRASKYFNFFPASVASFSDDDPIDVAVSHNRISILKYAVPFSEQLLLWSDQAQFVLTSNGILSAKSIELDLTTEFDVSDGARPFGIGRGVYFAAPRASFTSIKRYYAVQDVSDVKSAEDVSAHVPSYIPNTVHTIHGSGTENFVSILSTHPQARGKVHLYKFLYLQEELAQQSWSHWEFGDNTNVLACASIGSYMYLLLDRAVGVTLERVEFTAFTEDYPDEPYRAYMDMKKIVRTTDANYNIDTHTTDIYIESIYGGLPGPDDVFYTLDQKGVLDRHEPKGNTWVPGEVISMPGKRINETFVFGRAYSFLYEFSKFLIKQTADDGSSATEDIGRLQLRRVWLNYENSGAFTVNVHNGSSTFVYNMAGGRLGTEIILGEASLGTGQYKFPVSGNALNQTVTLFSDTPNPLNVIGCGFEGNYVRRSNGI